jgi:hypothetical protein|tara:strand:+ start:2265 stop:2462 length:198 start_codon:yes stop_codon:yes gene_type:complete
MEQRHTPKADHPGAQDKETKTSEIESEKARGGNIILNTPGRRAIFVGGLIAWVIFMVVAALIGYA